MKTTNSDIVMACDECGWCGSPELYNSTQKGCPECGAETQLEYGYRFRARRALIDLREAIKKEALRALRFFRLIK